MMKSVEVFINEYNTIHPNESPSDYNKASDLSYMFFLVECWWENANLSYDEFMEDKYSSHEQASRLIDDHKVFWLFNGLSFRDFYDHIQALIITRNDLSLTEFDYAVLVYLSLQDDDIKQTFEHFPLSTLREIFMPIAEAKFNDWKDA